MREQEQIKALAELDGFAFKSCDDAPEVTVYRKFSWLGGIEVSPALLPAYLTSYDAIIPILKKLNKPHCLVFYDSDPTQEGSMVIPTPAQLCEALLRATGKLKE
jgi:hypothetical protein